MAYFKKIKGLKNTLVNNAHLPTSKRFCTAVSSPLACAGPSGGAAWWGQGQEVAPSWDSGPLDDGVKRTEAGGPGYFTEMSLGLCRPVARNCEAAPRLKLPSEDISGTIGTRSGGPGPGRTPAPRAGSPRRALVLQAGGRGERRGRGPRLLPPAFPGRTVKPGPQGSGLPRSGAPSLHRGKHTFS